MIDRSKPLYAYQKKLAYQRHLDRLQQIQRQRSKKVVQSDSLNKMHRMRNKSIQFHTQKHLNNLNLQNQRIINSILHIKDKRKSFSTVQQPSSIQQFYNPARKRKQREIDHNNLCLAQRILAKHSQFDPSTQRRNIQLYEEVKKRMENNKRASLVTLQKVQRVKSMQKQRRKSTVAENYE